MGALTGAALGAGILAQGNNGIEYAGSPLGYLKEGNYAGAGQAAMKNIVKPQTYVYIAVPLIAWGAMKLLGVSGKHITKRVTLG